MSLKIDEWSTKTVQSQATNREKNDENIYFYCCMKSLNDQKAQRRKNKINNIRSQMKARLSVGMNPLYFVKKTSQKSMMEDGSGFGQGSSNRKLDSHAQFEKKYVIHQKIGEGCNGLVRKCYHKYKQQMFALKKISFEDDQIMYLKKNFCYMKEINHPHIIEYKSLYLDSRSRTCYLVMELFEHKDLTVYPHLSEDEIRIIAEQLIDAVDWLHKKKICHRDVKPENILYNPWERTIKLTDFGTSRKFDKYHRLMTSTGTLYYRAPETFSGCFYDQTIDQWAIGVTLYKLFTGKTPFQSTHVNETIQNIRKGQVDFEQEIWSKYSKVAKRFVKMLLMPAGERMSCEEAKNYLWFKHDLEKLNDVHDDCTGVNLGGKYFNRKGTVQNDGKDIWSFDQFDAITPTKGSITSWKKLESNNTLDEDFLEGDSDNGSPALKQRIT